jgi:hypothetical protein
VALTKTIAAHKRKPTRPFSRGEERYLQAIIAKGGNHAPSVRAAQGRKVTDRRSAAERRRDRRQRLVTLGRNRRA